MNNITMVNEKEFNHIINIEMRETFNKIYKEYIGDLIDVVNENKKASLSLPITLNFDKNKVTVNPIETIYLNDKNHHSC